MEELFFCQIVPSAFSPNHSSTSTSFNKSLQQQQVCRASTYIAEHFQVRENMYTTTWGNVTSHNITWHITMIVLDCIADWQTLTRMYLHKNLSPCFKVVIIMENLGKILEKLHSVSKREDKIIITIGELDPNTTSTTPETTAGATRSPNSF